MRSPRLLLALVIASACGSSGPSEPQGALAENLYQFCFEGADMKIAGPLTAGPAGEKIAAGVYTLSRQ